MGFSFYIDLNSDCITLNVFLSLERAVTQGQLFLSRVLSQKQLALF